MKVQRISILLLVLLHILMYHTSFSQVGSIGVNNTITSSVVNGDVLYIGGNFDRIGYCAGNTALLDNTTGANMMNMPPVAGYILTVIEDGSGGFYIGGNFTNVGSYSRNNLAHIKADYSVDPDFDPNVNNRVWTLALSGGVLYAGGEFVTVNGTIARNRLAAFDISDGHATPWNPDVNQAVYSMAASGGRIFAGGNFTSVNGSISRSYIAAFDASGMFIPSWNPAGINRSVFALIASGTRVYIGGSGDINTPTGPLLAVDNNTGSSLPGWVSPVVYRTNGASINAMFLSGNKLVIGGLFNDITDRNGAHNSYQGLAMFDAATGDVDLSWQPATGNVTIEDIRMIGNTVYVCGDFTAINGTPRNSAAAIDGATGIVTGWDPGVSGQVYALGTTPDNSIFTAGAFSLRNTVPVGHFAAIQKSTRQILNSGIAFNGTVNVLLLNGNRLYAGGSFTDVNGIGRASLAAINIGNGLYTLDMNWAPAGLNNRVNALAVADGRVYAGGTFTAPRNRLAAFEAGNTGILDSWNPNVGGVVNCLAASGTRLFIGGSFTAVGGATHNRLAAYDISNGPSDEPIDTWNPGLNQSVNALTVKDTMVYVGGSFTTVNGSLTRNRLAAFGVTSGLPASWDPNASSTVNSLNLLANAIVATGGFSSIHGEVNTRVAAINSFSGLPGTWRPSINGTVNTVGLFEDSIFVAGNISLANGDLVANMAFIATSLNNADLSSLTLSDGSLAPVFDDAIRDYAVTVNKDLATITMTASPVDPGASTTINGMPVLGGQASDLINLIPGENTIHVVSRSLDGTVTHTYTVKVTRGLSGNANLSDLQLSQGVLLPVFDPTIQEYTATVANNITSIDVTPTPAESHATVTVNGDADCNPFVTVALQEGENTITVEVTAQDGTIKAYVIKVTRLRPPSSNAYLSDLIPSTGTLSPAFSRTTNNYSVGVPNHVGLINITAMTEEAHASLKVNGSVVLSGITSPDIPLLVGANKIEIEVTAEDHTTQRKYEIDVTRSELSSEASLAALTLSAGTLSPAFTPTVFSYSVSVGSSVSTIQLTSLPAEGHATIRINGLPVLAGVPSAPIALNVGENKVSINLLAQDGTTSKTYMLTITREMVPPSSNADLAALTVSAGSLSPAFHPGTLQYATSVADPVHSVTITPQTVDTKASIQINGARVSSGSASAPIDLNTGENRIIISVVAEDGTTTKTYSLVITRLAAPPPPLSDNADLSGLSLSNGALSPLFTAGLTSYAVNVAYMVSSISVTPVAADPLARITINGQPVPSGNASMPLSLTVGSNTITVQVIAQNGSNSKTYILLVTRSASSSPGSIGLEISNAFSPNGDGKNDKLLPVLAGVKTLIRFQVYNRFGKLLFESTDSQTSWDGRYKGELQPLDTYLWTIEGYDNAGILVKKKGAVTLVR